MPLNHYCSLKKNRIVCLLFLLLWSCIFCYSVQEKFNTKGRNFFYCNRYCFTLYPLQWSAHYTILYSCTFYTQYWTIGYLKLTFCRFQCQTIMSQRPSLVRMSTSPERVQAWCKHGYSGARLLMKS